VTILSFFSTGAEEEERLASGRDIQKVELEDCLPYFVREKGGYEQQKEYFSASNFGDRVLY